jgi:Zn-dependent peptidase ImmA (M78 family)
VTLRQIRRRCQALADAIDVPDPFDLADFLAGVGAGRGRPITMLVFPLPAGAPRGVCVAADSTDYIIVDVAATGSQRVHIALHELSHLLLGHQLRVADLLRHLFQHLDVDLLQARRIHARTDFTAVEEQEAEMLASLLGQRARLWRPAPTPAPPPSALIERLGQSLEHRSDDNGR